MRFYKAHTIVQLYISKHLHSARHISTICHVRMVSDQCQKKIDIVRIPCMVRQTHIRILRMTWGHPPQGFTLTGA